jgi:hypothetical protein
VKIFKLKNKEAVHALIMALACSITAVILLVLSTPNNPYAYYEKDYFDDVQVSEEFLADMSTGGRTKRLNLPEDVLQNIDTETLTESILNHSGFLEVFLFNSTSYGMKRVVDNFNGFAELFTREDAGEVVFERYFRESRGKFHLTEEERTEHKRTLGKLELILFQDEILAQLSREDCEKLIEKIDENYGEHEPNTIGFDNAHIILKGKIVYRFLTNNA